MYVSDKKIIVSIEKLVTIEHVSYTLFLITSLFESNGAIYSPFYVNAARSGDLLLQALGIPK